MAPAEQVRPEQISVEQIGRALRTSWHRSPDSCTPIRSGMHSCTWQVDAGGQRFAAKLVPAVKRVQLEAGLFVVERLERGGVTAGLPIRAVDGALTVSIEGTALALLTWVPGRPLEPADGLDQQWWGGTLGAVHRQLRGSTQAGLVRFNWLRVDAPHLGIEPWVRPAVVAAIAGVRRLSVTDQLTYGVLHGDPAPDAFRLDPATGRVGLVDWAAAATGPLTYDIASAVMYAGGADRAGSLVEAYLEAGPVDKAELDAALPAMLRLRWAVEADYAAARLAADGVVGNGERVGHRAPLHQARAALAALDAAERADDEDEDW